MSTPAVRDRRASGGPLPAWLPVTAFMILYFMGSGAFTPYLQLYYQERGLSPVQIGTLTGVGPALAVVMPLFWGLMGDRSRRVRRLLTVTSILAAASFLSLSLGRSFAALMLLSALFSAFSLAGGPLSIALILGEAERLDTEYGSLRMWGSVGYAIGILAAGRLVSQFGTGAIFAGYGVPLLLSLIPLAWVHEADFSGSTLTWQEVRQALANRQLQVLLGISLLWRITSASYYTFFTIFINGMGASATMVSLAWATGLAGEVAVLRLSGRMARRIGIRGLLVIGLLGSALRWFAYSLAPSPAWTVPFQLLHGLTFGATTTAAVLAVDRIFPGGLRSTGQGVLSMVMWGIGGLVGSVAAGIVYQALGVRWLFGLSAGGAALTAVVAYALVRLRPISE